MSAIDITIVVVYLGGVLLLGYLCGKTNKSQDDYFLAGRSMPWLPVALSIAATMISANGFIGGPGWSYTSGMFPVMVNFAVPLAIIFALLFTTPVFYHLKITSIYEYMDLRLGRLSKALAIGQYFINSIIQISSMVFIPSLIVKMLTGLDMRVIVPIVVLLTLIYTMVGGIKAVIWTDAIQAAIVFLSVGMVIWSICNSGKLNLIDTLSLAKQSGKLNTINFSWNLQTENTFWAALIGGGVMWIRYFCFDQTQVQRVLTSKSLGSAKKSLVVSAFIMNIMYYLMLLIGVLLFYFYKGKDFASSNEIMIDFILKNIPIGFLGLIIAGVFASAMSSIDSLLNSMTSVFVKDIYDPMVPKEKRGSINVSLYVAGVIGILMIIIILLGFNGTMRSILDVVGKYISYFAGPAAGLFFLAFFTDKANDKGAFLGFMIGLVSGILFATSFQINWLWNPFIGAFTTFTFGLILSMVFIDEKATDKTKYSIWNINKEVLLKENNNINAKLVRFGSHEWIVLLFFLVQVIVYFLTQQ